jgi:quercetin dioxygenase-like cupin family protein
MSSEWRRDALSGLWPMPPEVSCIAAVREVDELLGRVGAHGRLTFGGVAHRGRLAADEVRQRALQVMVTARDLAPELDVCRRVWAQRGPPGPLAGHVYVNGPEAPGLPRHQDPYDILVVQLSGRKRWRLWQDPGHVFTLECGPGEAFWLPRGVPHEAVAVSSDGPSIHASLHAPAEEPASPTVWWPLREERFVPVVWPAAPLGSLRDEVGRRLATLGPSLGGASVWLRGSVLEAPSQHPAADIDLVVVAASREPLGQLDRALGDLGRRLDIMHAWPSAISPLTALLLATRAERLWGPPLRVLPPRLDAGLLRLLWRATGGGSLEAAGSPEGWVGACKRAIRAVGVLHLAAGGELTRDLRTCLDLVTPRFASLKHELTALGVALDTGVPAWPTPAVRGELVRLAAGLRIP